MSEEITITIKDNSRVALLVKNGLSKYVTMDSLCNAFAKNITYSAEDVPPGCRRVIRSKSRVAYVFTIPKTMARYNMAYSDDDERRYPIKEENIVKTTGYGHDRWISVNIPWPALVIVSTFTIDKNNVLIFDRQFAYATDDINKPVSDITLYKFPFTNVYNDNHVCTGDLRTYEFTIEQVGSTPGILVSGIGNHDLEYTCDEDKTTLRVSTSYGIIAKLANSPEIRTFPNDVLQRCLYKVSEIQNNWI